MACPSSNSIKPSSYAGYAEVHVLLAPSNATRLPHCRSFSFRRYRQTLENLRLVASFRHQLAFATDSTHSRSQLLGHNAVDGRTIGFRRYSEAIRASSGTGRRNTSTGKKLAGRRRTLLQAGSLIEKLDAEVAPLQENGSESAETQAEVQSRIAEAESSGKLDLSGLRLRELPPEVFDLTGLTELRWGGHCWHEKV